MPIIALVILANIFIAAVILVNILISNAFAKCAMQKGYGRRTYFWVCFFLGTIGYLIVAALPDKVLQQEIVSAQKNR